MNSIKYKLDNNSHQISFCTKGEKKNISKEIEKLKSDRNILLIYDHNINKNIIKQVFEDLKLSGCKIFGLRCEGNKINKNEKFLFKIIDLLLRKLQKIYYNFFWWWCSWRCFALASSLYLRGHLF